MIGGSGLIGSKLVAKLREHGHAVSAPSRAAVDTITGGGLPEALSGAGAVVDASNSPSLEAAAALEFFTTSTGNLLAAEAAAGVGHHVALSVVAAERLTGSGYFRAKLAQEQLIQRSSIPYTIVRATQCFEFITRLAAVRLTPARIQPIAADDIAVMVARVCVGPPVDGSIEIAGPDRFRLDELARRGVSVRDADARYFGAHLNDDTLLPGDEARLAETHFEDWLAP